MKRTLSRDIFSTSFFAVFGRGIGFLIPFLIAAAFGVTRETDSFFLAFGIILWVQLVFGNIYETAIVPFITKEISQNKSVSVFIGSSILRTTVALFLLVFLLLIGVKPLMMHLARFDPQTMELSYFLVIEMLPMVFLLAWTSILNGALNANRTFRIPALSPGIRSAIVLAAIVLFRNSLGVHAIAAGYVVGEIIRLLLSLYFFKKVFGPITWQWQIPDSVRQFFKSASIQTVAFSILTSLAFINQIMATHLGQGELTLLTYGERLRNIPYLLFVTGILPVIFSYWSGSHSKQAGSDEWKKIRKVLWVFTFGAALLSMGLVIGQFSIVSLAFGRGDFPSQSLVVVSGVFAYLVAGLPFDVLGLLCIRLFLIYGKEKYYIFFAILRVISTVFLNFILMKELGILGIALSTTAVNGVYAILLYVMVTKWIKNAASTN